MANRQQLYNAELQNDLDGKDKNIQNVNQIDAVATGSVYVDPALPEEIGKIDSLMAFKDLETAIRQTPDNYNIILRPGTYLYDGILEIRRSHIKLIGTGAIISPATAGQTAGLIISGSFVTIDGIIFDGLLSGSPTDTGTTIEVFRATNVELRNLVIRDQQGHGIELSDRYSSCTINNCNISGCLSGIAGEMTSDENITGVVISNNTIQACRKHGIILEGNSNVSVFSDTKIIGNDIVNVDRSGLSASAILISEGLRDVIISHNYISRSFYGINCVHSQRITVSNNSIAGIDASMTYFDGCQTVGVSNNLMDGANSLTGVPQAGVGVDILGFFATANDAGPYVISSNLISGIINNGKFVKILNANNVTVSSNQMTATGAYIYAESFQNLKISTNLITTSTNNPTIALDASTRGWIGCQITDNKFQSNGTQGRLISTNDTLGTGQKNIIIVGNISSEGKTYAQGIYDNILGAAPANSFLYSNSPQTIVRTAGEYDNRNGWVNDYQTTFTASHINIPTDSTYKYLVGGVQVVGSRITGWSLPTGTQARTTFDPATVTLAGLAQHLNALIHDLHIDTGHGLIGLVPANTPGYS
jgi:hypothetical protein